MTAKIYALPDVLCRLFSQGKIEGLDPNQIAQLGSIKYRDGKFTWTNRFGERTSGVLEGIIVELKASNNEELGVVFADDTSRSMILTKYPHCFKPLS